jgi:YggT family protein
MHVVINILIMLLDLYWWVVIGSVVLSWLMAFGIVNPYNPTVRSIGQALTAFTEPLLRPIRRVLPNTGAIDVSPIFLLIGLSIVRYLLSELRFA